MTFKGRDPKFTGKIRLPWTETDDCPCGSGVAAGRCCRLSNGLFYRAPRSCVPPSPRTGYSNADCYMRDTADCAEKISGEHFLSASVLKLLDPKLISVRGMPWLPAGAVRQIGINTLKSKILCKRHNEALAPLDSAAAEFFTAVREVFDDVADTETLSRKARWFLISGEELEMWMVKTAFGLFHSGNMAKGKESLRDMMAVDPAMLGALQGRRALSPCGLHVFADGAIHPGQRNNIDLSALLSDFHERMVGLRLEFMGLTLLLLFDTRTHYGKLDAALRYRPGGLQFRNRKRGHTIVLTWPDRHAGTQRLILFTAA